MHFFLFILHYSIYVYMYVLMLQFSYKPKTYSSETSTSTFLQKNYMHTFLFFYMGFGGSIKRLIKPKSFSPNDEEVLLLGLLYSGGIPWIGRFSGVYQHMHMWYDGGRGWINKLILNYTYRIFILSAITVKKIVWTI